MDSYDGPLLSPVLDPLRQGDSVPSAVLRSLYDRLAPEDELWKRRNVYYHNHVAYLCREWIPEGCRVLEIGCGTGHLLAALKPSHGVGVDLSSEMIRIGSERHPELTLVLGDAHNLPVSEQFDYVVIHNLLGNLDDTQGFLQRLRQYCAPDAVVVIVGYNYLWQYAIQLLEKAHLKMPSQTNTWLPQSQIRQLLALEDFVVIQHRSSLPSPRKLLGLGSLANLLAKYLPALRHLCLVQTTVARIAPETPEEPMSCTVVVPTRNEAGNVQGCVERTPRMGTHTEIIFVDGNSTDGTQEEIKRMIDRYEGEKDIRLLIQVPEEAEDDRVRRVLMKSQKTGKMLPQGKGHAVRLGFGEAKGDVLMILDADMTVPPEDLPRFFSALARRKADFANGSRLVYPMEQAAMRFPNLLGNKLFSALFSWILARYVGDTLCGTKALTRTDYERLVANRHIFGDFDPFGDFDLLFGAANLNMNVVDIPVRYRARVSGASKIVNTTHAPLLFKMCWSGFLKLKLSKWLGRR